MKHYEERLEHDLGVIRERIAAIAAMLDVALNHSVDALLALDRELASRTILGDLPVNRAVREVDRLCHVFVARHLPSARPLRYISSVLQLSVALERIGDYAVSIAREAVQLSTKAPSTVARDIEMMADHARRMLEQSMKAFNDGNPELARGTKGMASHSKTTFRKVYADLLKEGEAESRPIADLFALLMVFNRLERVSDQAKNICEETIFAATGEVKQPKVYRVLFVDAHNDLASVMAESIARKAYPASGRYESAGWAPRTTLRLPVVDYLDQHGMQVGATKPRPLPYGHDLDDYHVIVCVEGDGREHLQSIPFHTVLLNWDVSQLAGKSDAELDENTLKALSNDLTVRVRELVELLRGEDAA